MHTKLLSIYKTTVHRTGWATIFLPKKLLTPLLTYSAHFTHCKYRLKATQSVLPSQDSGCTSYYTHCTCRHLSMWGWLSQKLAYMLKRSKLKLPVPLNRLGEMLSKTYVDNWWLRRETTGSGTVRLPTLTVEKKLPGLLNIRKMYIFVNWTCP